jgi:cholesterol oxidase
MGQRGLAQDRPVRRVPGRGRHTLAFEVLNRTASAHFIESIPIAGTAETGAADPCRRISGYLGLHVIPRA